MHCPFVSGSAKLSGTEFLVSLDSRFHNTEEQHVFRPQINSSHRVLRFLHSTACFSPRTGTIRGRYVQPIRVRSLGVRCVPVPNASSANRRQLRPSTETTLSITLKWSATSNNLLHITHPRLFLKIRILLHLSFKTLALSKTPRHAMLLPLRRGIRVLLHQSARVELPRAVSPGPPAQHLLITDFAPASPGDLLTQD